MIPRSPLMGTLCILFSVAMLQQVNAQCPDGTNLTRNTFCLVANWLDVPAPLPPNMVANGATYTLFGGQGSSGNPAVYKSGGGNGACNSHQNGFTGSLMVGNEVCAYQNGALSPSLPVSLLTYNVHKMGESINIEWETTSEVNNEYFTIERSYDLASWEEIARIEGSNLEVGNSQYLVVDKPEHSGSVLYRLSQQDVDGKLTILGIRSINMSGFVDKEVSLYPNPGSDVVYISPATLEIQSLDLIDYSGRTIKTTLPGQNFIELFDIIAGLYVVRITEKDGERQLRKLVVE